MKVQSPAAYTSEARGHVWELENGEPTYNELSGYHAGPLCVNCYHMYCKHCQDGPHEDCDSVPSEADPGDESEEEFKSAC